MNDQFLSSLFRDVGAPFDFIIREVLCFWFCGLLCFRNGNGFVRDTLEELIEEWEEAEVLIDDDER